MSDCDEAMSMEEVAMCGLCGRERMKDYLTHLDGQGGWACTRSCREKISDEERYQIHNRKLFAGIPEVEQFDFTPSIPTVRP